jgi:predicted 3-demethylubiquinone-9 3-methyltransferase (glyoxalase superfamily)
MLMKRHSVSFPWGRARPDTKIRSALMSSVTPCLWFEYQAEEAVGLYVSLLPDSRIDRIQRNPIDTPAGRAGTVLVIEFTLGGGRFMALNGGERAEYTHAVSFSVACADQGEIDRLWARLSDGGTVLQCGWLKDRYGVSWQIVPAMLPDLLADPDPQRSGRVMQALLGMVKLDIAGLREAYDG